MSEKDRNSEAARKKPGGGKADRLAENLRANLKRRKEQARARSESQPPKPDEPQEGKD